MTIAQSVFAKASVAFVALAMAFTLVAPAQAQSVDDMSLDDLIALVNQLQAQLGGSASVGVTSSVCPYTWTRNLNTGDTGADVMQLQMFLNSMPETQVAPVGAAGSAGLETQYYGPATGAAVANFQMKYRSEVLSPLGLVNPTTFFGNSTRAQANDLCLTAPVTPGTGDEDDMDEDEDDDDNDRELSGSADLDTYEIDDADDDTVEEGADEEELAIVTVEFDDGDALINRLELDFTLDGSQAGAEEDAWDTFDTISLWVDGDMISEVDGSDEDEWDGSDDSEITFSNLDLFAEEGEEIEFTVVADIQNGLDFTTSNDQNDWTITLNNDSLRFEDADGFVQEEDPTGSDTTAQFTIVEEGTDDDISVRSSSDDPNATTLPLKDDEKTEFVIFAFEFDADDSDNDIEIEEFTLDATTTGQTDLSVLVDDIRVIVDGDEVDTDDVTVNSDNIFVEFDRDDFVVQEGERPVVEIEVEFNSLAMADEGSTIQLSLDGDNVKAESSTDLTVDGSSTGDVHTLRTEGVILDKTDESFSKDLNGDSSDADDEGIFTLKYEVTAFEEDFFFNKSATRGLTSTSSGAEFRVTTDGGSTVVTSGTTTASLTSSADTQGSRYVVREGETETFTLKVTYDPASSGFYAIQLEGVNFFTDGTVGNDTVAAQDATPDEDFRTDEFDI